MLSALFDGNQKCWESNRTFRALGVAVRCSVNCWIRLTTYCAVLGAARCCSALFDGNQKCWESNRTFLLFEVFI